MSIQPNQPHIIIEIDDQGNLTTEAQNYLNQGGVCQGEIATSAFEEVLVQENLIPQVDPNQRKYKPGNNLTQQVSQQSNQQLQQ